MTGTPDAVVEAAEREADKHAALFRSDNKVWCICGYQLVEETLGRHKLRAVLSAAEDAARAQELREAADLIAVAKFNDPFRVNREVWKLLRDRADALDPTDEFQDSED